MKMIRKNERYQGAGPNSASGAKVIRAVLGDTEGRHLDRRYQLNGRHSGRQGQGSEYICESSEVAFRARGMRPQDDRKERA